MTDVCSWLIAVSNKVAKLFFNNSSVEAFLVSLLIYPSNASSTIVMNSSFLIRDAVSSAPYKGLGLLVFNTCPKSLKTYSTKTVSSNSCSFLSAITEKKSILLGSTSCIA